MLGFKKYQYAIIAGLITLFILGDISHAIEETEVSDVNIESTSDNALVEPNYSVVFKEWNQIYQFIDNVKVDATVQDENVHWLPIEKSEGYSKEVIMLNEGESITYKVSVPATGLYQISMDYFSLAKNVLNTEFSLQINNEFPYFESRNMIATSLWENANNEFFVNDFGHEMIPEQKIKQAWQTDILQDAKYQEKEGLYYLLNEGENTLTFTVLQSSMLIGNVAVHSGIQPQNFTEYYQLMNKRVVSDTKKELSTYQAEKFAYKNTSYIVPIHSSSPDVEPYSSSNKLLNILGSDYWSESGESVTWDFQIEKSGWYQISFKKIQNYKKNSPVFRKILIDNQIPFSEVYPYRFESSNNWDIETLSDDQNTPFEFYLEEGNHTLTLIADSSPLTEIIESLQQIMNEIGDTGLAIKKLTGNQPDQNRKWKLNEYLPEIEDQFDSWQERIQEAQENLNTIYGSDHQSSSESLEFDIILTNFEKLADNLDKLPSKLNEFSEGSNSVLQKLANLQESLAEQPIAFDSFYIHGSDVTLPNARASRWKTMKRRTSEFVHSFGSTGKISNNYEKTLEVWVARSQMHVELMQNMADRLYTPNSGVKVNFSVMADDSKLILANAGNHQPDVALGVSVGTPYELAIRGAALDLSQFSDFKNYISRFSPGAFAAQMLDDKVYALPETQDFYVLFYRKDILDKLNIDVPNTWEEVTGILPELQRYGMNFFIPLSGSSGSKPFMFTAPFIYQSGGELYDENGITTVINTENSMSGLQLMTDLYTLYSLPLQVSSFYQSFRYGTLPIGISNFENYVKLMATAPEIANSWEIALYPGIENEEGIIERWATGSAQQGMIFEKSEQPEEAWDFLKWWMDTDTQVEFANQLQINYGPSYMWNSANLEAFAQLPWSAKDKKIILEQWEWLREVPKTPGSYILEREISNTWTDVVFNGVNLRSSVDEHVIIINREMQRKLTEFGYVDDGEIVKPYKIPTINTVEEWIYENQEKHE